MRLEGSWSSAFPTVWERTKSSIDVKNANRPRFRGRLILRALLLRDRSPGSLHEGLHLLQPALACPNRVLGADLNRSESLWLLLARERAEVRIGSDAVLRRCPFNVRITAESGPPHFTTSRLCQNATCQIFEGI
jgi:hypothetical protein